MKLVYNTVVKASSNKVWDLLGDLEKRSMWIKTLDVEKNAENSYIFYTKEPLNKKPYRVVLLDKKENKKISFSMNRKNTTITKTYFLSNNGIETYIKHYIKINERNMFKKIFLYPAYYLNFRKKLKAEFQALKEHCSK